MTQPMEHELRSLTHLNSLTSTTDDGIASIVLAFNKGTDMVVAVDRIKQRVSQEHDLPVVNGSGNALIRLGDIADIERRQSDDQRLIEYDGSAAVMTRVRRPEGSDALDAAAIMYDWYDAHAQTLAAQGIRATIWLEAWRFARKQIALVLKNGVGGILPG